MKNWLKNNRKKIIRLAFFPIAILYLEILTVHYGSGGILAWGWFYITLASVAIGLVVTLISFIGKDKWQWRIAMIEMFIITFVFGSQAVYSNMFSTYTTLSALVRAGDVLTDFWKQAISGIWRNVIPLIFIFTPFGLLVAFGKRFVSKERITLKNAIILLLVSLAINTTRFATIMLNKSGIMSYKYVYKEIFSPELSVPRFGILGTLELDFRNLIKDNYGVDIAAPITPTESSEPVISEPSPSPSGDLIPRPSPSDEVVVYEDNVLEIDFDALIAGETNKTLSDMHSYFASAEPTSKNEYTEMFEGKNLIWIVGEAFSSFALDEQYTPTLSKLAGEGFVFNNFYNPIWGVSTSDGEYVTTTGLLPKPSVWSYSRSSSNYMPFGFGTMLSNEGYEAYAYHNHTYIYYDRHLSHPNMGYEYKGVGNGLQVTNQWPESDIEMMENTMQDYISADSFVAYYMTVSGHLEYNYNSNAIAAKYKNEVADLPYSTAAKAYIATQIELDRAIEYLISELDAAGVLEDTVIVISGDHYPYGLKVSEMEEIAGGDIEENFELYRSTLIIWNSEMETVEVDKYCSSLDVMPTLANLFGLDYDSRLVMGRDILSDAPALVMFNNRSYITEYGRYNARTDTFTANEGAELDEGYASEMLKIVNERFKYSALILETDYYQRVLKSE